MKEQKHPRGTQPYIAIGTVRVSEWAKEASQLRVKLNKLVKELGLRVTDFEWSISPDKYADTIGEVLPEVSLPLIPEVKVIKEKLKAKERTRKARPPTSQKRGRTGKKVERIVKKTKTIVRRKTRK